MKKISLIAILFIALVSCSKEELKSNSSNIVDEGGWIVTKKNVVVSNVKCDELTNRNTKQVVYKQNEIDTDNKAPQEAEWTNSARLDGNGCVQCDGLRAKNCFTLASGGIVIQKGVEIPSDK